MTGPGASPAGVDPVPFVALDPAVALALRLTLAALLLSAALHKARDLPGFTAILAGYGLLPAGGPRPVARVLPAGEAAIGLALLAPAAGAAAALAGAALLALYTAAAAVALARGRRGLPCGCGGPAGAGVLGPALLARNAVLVTLALVAALPVATRPLVWIDVGTVVGSVAALALIYAAADRLIANGPALRALRALRAPTARGPGGPPGSTSLRPPSVESTAGPSLPSTSPTSPTPSTPTALGAAS